MHQFQLNLVTVISTGPPSSGTLEVESGPMFQAEPDFCVDHPHADSYVVTRFW